MEDEAAERLEVERVRVHLYADRLREVVQVDAGLGEVDAGLDGADERVVFGPV